MLDRIDELKAKIRKMSVWNGVFYSLVILLTLFEGNLNRKFVIILICAAVILHNCKMFATNS